MKLDEKIQGKILNAPIVRVWYFLKQQPLVEFMIYALKVVGTYVAGIRKRFLKREFQLVFEFVN